MKKLLAKLQTDKGLPLLLVVLAVAAGLLFLLPSSSEPDGMTAEEIRISRILSDIQGAGETRISIHYSEKNASFGSTASAPAGAVIVSRGAGNMAVRLRLTEAARALLSLNDENIAVFPMEEAE